MRVSFLVPFALLIPLLAASCSDGSATIPAVPVAAADFMDSYVTTLCQRADRCYLVASYLAPVCESGVQQSFGEDLKAAIATGRIVYDEAAAGECIAGLAETDCLAEQPSDATLEACLSALGGTIAPGKACFGTFECKAGVCPAVTGDECPALCPAVARLGEACSLLGGPDCDVREGLRCAGGTCVAPQAEGGECADNFACQSGLVCVANACGPLRGEQQGCSQDASCEPGLFCASGGDEGGICERRLPEGGECARDVEDRNAAFRLVQCAEGLVCKGAGLEEDGTNIAGSCSKASAEGGSCTTEPDGLQLFATGCQTGLVCNAGKCERPPAVGAACTKHFECLTAEAYCDPMSLMCLAPKANGEACSMDRECAGGFCGMKGTCTDLATFCGP
jgi:hypothetical protein